MFPQIHPTRNHSGHCQQACEANQTQRQFMKTDNLPSVFRKVLAKRRSSRVDFILSKVTTKDEMNVIDIGCGIDGRSFDDHVPANWKITGIDIHPTEQVSHEHPNFTYILQDAQDLSNYEDQQFDLAVSIGMLEHITREDVFQNIVSEIQRVAKQYLVVVPYKYCWIEPHYGVPFFPLLPYAVKLWMVKTFNLSKHRKAVTENPDYIDENYRWLSNSEYQSVFPDSRILLLPTLELIAITKAAEL